ncbi:hypothetical protein BHE74_00032435, partial [Ensete ventricosum]
TTLATTSVICQSGHTRPTATSASLDTSARGPHRPTWTRQLEDHVGQPGHVSSKTTSFAQRFVIAVGNLVERDLKNRRKQRPTQSHTHRSAESASLIKYFDTISLYSTSINTPIVAHMRRYFSLTTSLQNSRDLLSFDLESPLPKS